MNYDFSKLKNKLAETNSWLSTELSSIRTGRATPNLIEKVTVESYGSRVPIKQLATISIEDARTLRITLWDKKQIADVQTSIDKANLGISVSADDAGLRVVFPELTKESRIALLKIVNDRIEKARVSIRKDREDIWNDIQKKEKNSEIGEDDKFRFKDELQKIVDDTIELFEKLKVSKTKEISN